MGARNVRTSSTIVQIADHRNLALAPHAISLVETHAAENPSSGKYAELPGVKLWFTDTGSKGTPVVLLHANTGTSAAWEPQVTAFSRADTASSHLTAEAGVKAWQTRPSGPQPGTIADDLDALADHLKLRRFHLIGVAGGGFAALDYAAWRPQRLRSLVIGASTGRISDKEIAEFIARIEIPEIRKQPAAYREVSPSYRGANPEGTNAGQRLTNIRASRKPPINRFVRRTLFPRSRPSPLRLSSSQRTPICLPLPP
jgi:pimeloyl-ACP methyl ester carboxylesterase